MRAGQHQPRFDPIRVTLQCLAANHFGFGISCHVDQQRGEAYARRRVGRIGGEARAIFALGLVESQQRMQRTRKIVARVGIARVQRQRALIACNRIACTALIAQYVAAVKPQRRLIRVVMRKPLEQRFCFRVAALLGKRIGQAHFMVGLAWIDPACLAIGVFRLRMLRQCRRHLPEVCENSRIIAPQPRGVAQVCQCLLWMAKLLQCSAREVQSIRIVGLQVQGALVAR